MKKFKLASILVTSFTMLLAACNAGPTVYDLTFHQTEPGVNEDKVVEVIKGVTTQVDVWAEEPAINEKAGYSAEWESYNVEEMTSDLTVEPIYTPINYTATFKNRVTNTVLGTTTFTVESEELTNWPELPTDLGYTYAWETYQIRPENITVYCDRTANLHTIKFFEDAAKQIQVGETLQFTCETVAIDEPEVPVHTGYDGYWPEYDLTLDQDIEVVAVYELHKYYLKFMFEGTQVGDLVGYNITQSYQDLVKPEVPSKTGYNVSWPEDCSLLLQEIDNPQIVNGIASAKKYTVSYAGTEDKTSVTYDAPYTLENPGDNYSWYYGETKVPTTGDKWTIDGTNITLTKKYSYVTIDFEDGELPNVISKNVGNESLEVVATNTFNGEKALQVSGVSHNYGIKFTSSYFDAIFADPNVDAIAFEAKGSGATNDFRRYASYLGKNVCYETNANGYGLDTHWKTFFYTREYYNNDKTVAGSKFFVCGAPTVCASILVDNIRAVTEMPTPYGFENGAPNIKIESDGRVHPMVKTAGHSDTSAGEYVANIEYFNFVSAIVSSAELCSDNKSEGNYSLKFVKSASGYLAFYTIRNVKELMGPNGTFSFDLYSTVQANGNAQVTNFQDGRNQVSLGSHTPNEWHTYTLDGSQITDDGRFLILQGSTAGDWYIDNIRVNYAA